MHMQMYWLTFLPGVTPGVVASTTNPVNALLVLALGSVLARTKYQLATPPLLIHILDPFITHYTQYTERHRYNLFHTSFPFLTAVVFTAATSEPQSGSVTP